VKRKIWYFALELLLISLIACNYPSSTSALSFQNKEPIPNQKASQMESAASSEKIFSKWGLWSSGKTQLRGANIWQSLVIPAIDGDFKGNGRAGPPYSQEDFDQLAALGANYLVLSIPGIFTENPPYQVDAGVLQVLDDLINKAKKADLFVTIAFRTGPGRAEWSLCCYGESDYEGYFNDKVWTDAAAQQAWAEMWQTTAKRYHDHPEVVGYELMVEPDGEDILLDIWNPEDFYPKYKNSSYDWNQFYPRIVNAIRAVDQDTPIIVGSASYNRIQWLPYLKFMPDQRIVYEIHQYDPHDSYTHQESTGHNSYPGNFDLDGDGKADRFDQKWLAALFNPVVEFSGDHHAPITINEYGVKRWVPKAASFIKDQVDIFETNGWNHAIWVWPTSYGTFSQVANEFNFRLGPDPANKSKNAPSQLLDTIMSFWKRNLAHPSDGDWK
jgi:hypothetical protein